MTSTLAWVLTHDGGRLVLQQAAWELGPLGPDDVLVEPIYGCWEANMSHALCGEPIDICKARNEASLVLGNAGVVRVLQAGADVTLAQVGDLCLVFGNAAPDEAGYMTRALAYDAPGTMGVLAKRSRLHQRNVIPIPAAAPGTEAQWAAFSLRYITAWSNWRAALGCWRLAMGHVADVPAHCWGWGGGVAFAELQLAAQLGSRAVLLTSSDKRAAKIEAAGMIPVDRRPFGDLRYDRDTRRDPARQDAFKVNEKRWLDAVGERTDGRGASIFIDNLGGPLTRVTLKALGRQGVLATCGWKLGVRSESIRAAECIAHHTHVHTHYARYDEGIEAVRYAAENNWLPPADLPIYGWDEIPRLAADYDAGRICSYFPLFAVAA